MDLDTLGYFLYMDKMEKAQQDRSVFDEDDSSEDEDEDEPTA